MASAVITPEQAGEEFLTELERIQATFKKRHPWLSRECFGIDGVPASEFPEMIVTVPDSWPRITLAPLYDVHIGAPKRDEPLLARHLNWIARTPYLLTWDGGDIVENGNKQSPGNSGGEQKITVEEQIILTAKTLAPIQHKMLFKLAGNHEDRTINQSGSDTSKRIANDLKLPYYPDYCFCTIKWRGNKFRLMGHHGAGGAATPGAQRNTARKDMPWAFFDIFWMGHVHQAMADIAFRTDFDQKTGRMVERSSIIMISPSYLKYFGGYAAKKRLSPGIRGMGVVELQDDGRIDVSLHARGKRL